MVEHAQRFRGGGRAVVILLLAAAGAGSWWWLKQQRQAPAPVAERRPDSYFRELDIVQHADNGQPETRVRAAYAEHFPDEDWIRLRRLQAHGLAAGPGWRLVADHGRLSDDGVELDAWGDVVLKRADDNEDGMRLYTERLEVNTETRIAATDAAVRIVQGASEIRGEGMWASLADDRLVLESKVEARYAQ